MLGFYGGRGLLGLYGEQGERKVLRARAPRRPFARVRKVRRFQIRTDRTDFVGRSERTPCGPHRVQIAQNVAVGCTITSFFELHANFRNPLFPALHLCFASRMFGNAYSRLPHLCASLRIFGLARNSLFPALHLYHAE